MSSLIASVSRVCFNVFCISNLTLVALLKFLHDAVQHNLHPFQIMRPLVGIHHSFLNNAFIVKYWYEGVGRNTH